MGFSILISSIKISFSVLYLVVVRRVDSVCVTLSTMVKNDVYLQNNVIGVLQTPGLLDCGASCQSHTGCLSFGFEPRKGLCHLHNEDESSAPEDLVPKSRWIHGNLSAFPQELWGPCANHNCTVGQKCIRHRATKKALCVNANLPPPPGLCPSPPQLVNGHISRGGQEVGSSRSFTCQEGYLDTESFLSSDVTTCLPDFTWSRPNLTCSGPYIREELTTKEQKTFQTLQDETFNDVVGNTSSVLFFSKSCRDCIIGLCQYIQASIEDCHIIAIGFDGNRGTEVRAPGNKNRATHREPEVLSCTEFRPFWISWRDGTIAVGKGNTVGRQEIASRKPSYFFNISYVGLSVFTHNTGVWLFLKQN